MRQRRHSLVLAWSLAALVGGGPACRGGSSSAGAASATIRVSGAWALYPLMVRWAEVYRARHPGVRIAVTAGGAGKGVADALAGLVDIGMVSRAVKPVEVGKGAFSLAVVSDAVFPTISADNPHRERLAATGIKRRLLRQLFVAGQPLTWGQLVGSSAPERVQLYTRSDACGAAETWALYLGVRSQEELRGVGVYGDPGIAEAVRRDRLAIGYNNLANAFDLRSGEPTPGIRVLALDVNDNGRVDPAEAVGVKAQAVAAVRSGAYPAPPARELNLVTRGRCQGATASFVRWILTDGQPLVDELGFVRLPADRLAASLSRLGR